jgi:hypothetical protein
VPAHNTPIKPGRREALLIAIGKARKWIDDLARGRAASFAVIARQEGKVERHVRLVAPLAFLSPRIVSGTAPADLTVTAIAQALPYSWAEQEQRVGILPSIQPAWSFTRRFRETKRPWGLNLDGANSKLRTAIRYWESGSKCKASLAANA